MRKHLNVLIFLSTIFVIKSTFSCEIASNENFVYLNENFSLNNNSNNVSFRNSLLKNKYISFVEGKGSMFTNRILVKYVGSDIGSNRVIETCRFIHSYSTASLKYDVYFDESFQWTHGGKLHGIGSVNPLTGGRLKNIQDWSVRVAFKENGGGGLYIYDMSVKRWGDLISAKHPIFQKGKWHKIELLVTLNDPSASNGLTELFVDGVSVVKKDNLILRKTQNHKSKIGTILFNTFHGGNKPKWAPKEDSKYTTSFAYFDNFVFYAKN